MRGVIEYVDALGSWEKTGHDSFEGLFRGILSYPTAYLHSSYRYREGSRAVMLWPESEMGKVVELG